MKSLIIYLSMAGNTKTAAESVQAGIIESGHECNLREMRDLTNENIAEEMFGYDIIGLMSPVYAWREPTVWRKFLINLPVFDHQLAFIGATAASEFGNYFFSVNHFLQKKGIISITCLSIRAPPTFVPWNSPQKSGYEWNSVELDFAKEFGTRLFQVYEDAVNGSIKKMLQMKFNLAFAALAGFSCHDFTLHKVLGNKSLDQSRCTKCGICVRSCAWNAISMENSESFPEFDETLCGACCTCINICPSEAISTKSTKGKIKYHDKEYHGRKTPN